MMANAKKAEQNVQHSGWTLSPVGNRPAQRSRCQWLLSVRWRILWYGLPRFAWDLSCLNACPAWTLTEYGSPICIISRKWCGWLLQSNSRIPGLFDDRWTKLYMHIEWRQAYCMAFMLIGTNLLQQSWYCPKVLSGEDLHASLHMSSDRVVTSSAR